MNALKNLSLILLLSLAFTGCHNKSSKINDFNLLLYAPEYASGFDIKGAGGKESVLITVRNPWQGADSVTTWLFIVRNGEEVPEGFAGQVLKGDAKRIVAMSSTHIAMLDAIGEVRCITGVSGIDYISNPDIQARRDSIGDVGYEGNINYELLLSLDPDLVLLYGVNGASAMESKLEELDIPFMYVGDYLEESPLGKAEWMVVLSEVTGKREKGEKAFAAIPVRYNALKKKVADSTLGTPSVMLNVPYGDSWFMPSTQSYVARLITDAGGRYIYQKNTGNASIPIDLEEAYLLASDADMWLNVGMANSLDDLKASCPKFTDTRCFKNGEVYNNNARTNTAGGNDYYESAYGGGEDLQEKLKSYGNTTDMTWVAGAQYNYNFDRCLFMPATLTAGAEYNQDRLKDNMWGRGRYLDQRVNTVSAFAQNEWKTARWSFLVGARMDKHSLLDKPVFSPRANVRFNPTDNINLRASYSFGFRAPQAFDEDLHIDNVGGTVSMIQLAKDLKEEKSQSLSLSADMYHSWGDWQGNLLAEGFYTNISDVFALTEIGKDENGVIINERGNEKGAVVYGCTLEGKLAWRNVWQLQAGFTVQQARYKEARSWSENDPNVPLEKRMFRTPDTYGSTLP